MVVESTVAVPAGCSELTARFRRLGGDGTVALEVDGVPCGRADLPPTCG